MLILVLYGLHFIIHVFHFISLYHMLHIAEMVAVFGFISVSRLAVLDNYMLTLKAPNKNCSRQHLIFFSRLSVVENKALCFM